LGNSQVITREPSSGGIGSRLKAASTRLMPMVCRSTDAPSAYLSHRPRSSTRTRPHSVKNTASRKFEAGPAMATKAMSRSGLRRL
jgi:hypothetical protein